MPEVKAPVRPEGAGDGDSDAHHPYTYQWYRGPLMRFLYLDDSGKPEPQHASKALVFGGFSVDQRKWHDVVRLISGAKAVHFPGRGRPSGWELKSEDFLTRNAWNRGRNRRFCFELVEILRRNGCVIYAAWLVKANAAKTLDKNWVVLLCFQRLAAKFERELIGWGAHGAITCDWSTYPLDRHVSNCVQTFVLKHGIRSIVGGVTYGSSMSMATIQACDLIAVAFRRAAEGQTHLMPFVDALRSLVRRIPGETDVLGYSSATECQVF